MKTVSVPMSEDALRRLDMGEDKPGDLIEEEIEKEDFDNLFSSGWVRDVNNILGVNIDDFEDEHIMEADKIAKLVDISRRYYNTQGGEVFLKIESLAKTAEEKKTGVHFFF